MNKNIYRAGDGTWMLDLPEGQETSYGTNYIQGRTKKDVQNEYNDLLNKEASKHMNKVIRTRDSNLSKDYSDVIFRYVNGTLRVIPVKEYQLTDDNLQTVIDESISKWDDNYARLYMTKISPDDFLRLTMSSNDYDRFMQENKSNGISNLDTNILQNKNYVADMMYLDIDLGNKEVYGHEGRHRMLALKDAGYKKVDLVVWARNYDKYNAVEYDNFTVNGQEKQHHEQATFKKLVPVSKANVERIKKRDY